MDGNFKAEHMWPKNPANEVWLVDGMGFMVTMPEYKAYLAGTVNSVEVSNCKSNMVQPADSIQRNQTAATIKQ